MEMNKSYDRLVADGYEPVLNLPSYVVVQHPVSFHTVFFFRDRKRRPKAADRTTSAATYQMQYLSQISIPGLSSDPEVLLPAGMWREWITDTGKYRSGDEAPRFRTTVRRAGNSLLDDLRQTAATTATAPTTPPRTQVRQLYDVPPIQEYGEPRPAEEGRELRPEVATEDMSPAAVTQALEHTPYAVRWGNALAELQAEGRVGMGILTAEENDTVTARINRLMYQEDRQIQALQNYNNRLDALAARAEGRNNEGRTGRIPPPGTRAPRTMPTDNNLWWAPTAPIMPMDTLPQYREGDTITVRQPDGTD